MAASAQLNALLTGPLAHDAGAADAGTFVTEGLRLSELIARVEAEGENGAAVLHRSADTGNELVSRKQMGAEDHRLALDVQGFARPHIRPHYRPRDHSSVPSPALEPRKGLVQCSAEHARGAPASLARRLIE